MISKHPPASTDESSVVAGSGPLPRVSGELPNLDILRTLAVGLVFIGHVLAVLGIRGFGELAHFGVLLFFVHTSLVLMMSMERTHLTGRALYTSFSIRRVFRIYPLSILCVVLFVLFEIPSSFWLSPYAAPDGGAIASNLLLVQNLTQDRSVNCVLWSLPFEVQMYAVLPFVFLFVAARGKRPRAALTLLGVGALVTALEVLVRGRGGLILRYVPCFLAGVLAWTLLGTVRPRFRALLWLGALALLVVGFRVAGLVRVYGPDPTAWFAQGLRTDGGIWWPPALDPLRDAAFCLATGLLIPLFASSTTRAIVAPCKLVAKYSYGIYLWHVPILWLVFSVLGTPGGRTGSVVLVFLGTAACAVAGYHLLEDPAVRWGKTLARRAVRGA